MDPEGGEAGVLVKYLLPDAPESWRWVRLGRPSVAREPGRVALSIPHQRRDGTAIAIADVGQGSDLKKEPTGIELLQGGVGVAGLEGACHQELITLTLVVEARCVLIQLDPEGTRELPSARKPGARSNLLEGGIGMGEEGTAEANFEFQLFEGAPDQGAREVLRPVSHQKNLLRCSMPWEWNKSGMPMPRTCLGPKRRRRGRIG
jgi:hypothetical protein